MATNQCCAGKDTGELITNIKNLMINRDINHIPRQSVYYWLNKWETPKIIYEETTTPSTLYIMADEKFIGCQDLENDIMGKCMISFEDVKKQQKIETNYVTKQFIQHIQKSLGKSS